MHAVSQQKDELIVVGEFHFHQGIVGEGHVESPGQCSRRGPSTRCKGQEQTLIRVQGNRCCCCIGGATRWWWHDVGMIMFQKNTLLYNIRHGLHILDFLGSGDQEGLCCRRRRHDDTG